MEGAPSNLSTKRIEQISMVENKIRELLPISELIKIFGNDSFLIGGAVRDFILNKNPSDLDFMSRSSVETIKKNLEDLGFIEMEWEEDVKFIEGKYSLKKGADVFNFIINGMETQVASIGEKEVSKLIQTADLNLSCCAFSLDSSKILNTNFLIEISNKELRFMDIELAKNDPMKIINALKQISRIPDLKISDETMGIIEQSIPMIIDFFTKNSHRRHKLKPLFGNINSGQILNLFENFDTKGIFDGIEMKKPKLNVSDRYFSNTAEGLTTEAKAKLSNFVASQFGKRFDPTKLFNNKINSVAYELDNKGNILSCCLIDGERLYATSAISPEKIVEIVSDLCKNNYNIWSTISITSTLLINLCPKAGLNIVTDYDLVEKIVTNNYPKYKGKLIVETKRGYTVFSKKDSADTPQVLVMS